MATVQAASPVDLAELAKARRTEAMPKHSLFGSTLEIHNQNEMDQIQKIDISKPGKQPRRKGRFQLPEEFRSQLQGLLLKGDNPGDIQTIDFNHGIG